MKWFNPMFTKAVEAFGQPVVKSIGGKIQEEQQINSMRSALQDLLKGVEQEEANINLSMTGMDNMQQMPFGAVMPNQVSEQEMGANAMKLSELQKRKDYLLNHPLYGGLISGKIKNLTEAKTAAAVQYPVSEAPEWEFVSGMEGNLKATYAVQKNNPNNRVLIMRGNELTSAGSGFVQDITKDIIEHDYEIKELTGSEPGTVNVIQHDKKNGGVNSLYVGTKTSPEYNIALTNAKVDLARLHSAQTIDIRRQQHDSVKSLFSGRIDDDKLDSIATQATGLLSANDTDNLAKLLVNLNVQHDKFFSVMENSVNAAAAETMITIADMYGLDNLVNTKGLRGAKKTLIGVMQGQQRDLRAKIIEYQTKLDAIKIEFDDKENALFEAAMKYNPYYNMEAVQRMVEEGWTLSQIKTQMDKLKGKDYTAPKDE